MAFDPDAAAVLLAAVQPGTMADELAEPPSATAWGELVRALHGMPPPCPPRGTLAERCAEMFERKGRELAHPAIAARIGGADWARARRRCDALLSTSDTAVLLHGDLHLGNVLDGGARGLVAIDPRACVGDPCWDAVDYATHDPHGEGIAARSARTAAACGLDPERLLARRHGDAAPGDAGDAREAAQAAEQARHHDDGRPHPGRRLARGHVKAAPARRVEEP